MSAEQQTAKAGKKKKNETAVEGKEKKRQEVDKLSACHARNALYEVKGDIHLNDQSMRLVAKAMQDYLERLADEASYIGDKRDSHKNTIKSEDVIAAANVVPMIFPEYIFEGYVEKPRAPKTKKPKKPDEGTVEATQEVEVTA